MESTIFSGVGLGFGDPDSLFNYSINLANIQPNSILMGTKFSQNSEVSKLEIRFCVIFSVKGETIY